MHQALLPVRPQPGFSHTEASCEGLGWCENDSPAGPACANMRIMSTIDTKTDIDDLLSTVDSTPEPGHDQWFREKVQDTLKKKAAGQMTYRSLDDVADDLGLNAR